MHSGCSLKQVLPSYFSFPKTIRCMLPQNVNLVAIYILKHQTNMPQEMGFPGGKICCHSRDLLIRSRSIVRAGMGWPFPLHHFPGLNFTRVLYLNDYGMYVVFIKSAGVLFKDERRDKNQIVSK